MNVLYNFGMCVCVVGEKVYRSVGRVFLVLRFSGWVRFCYLFFRISFRGVDARREVESGKVWFRKGFGVSVVGEDLVIVTVWIDVYVIFTRWFSYMRNIRYNTKK